MPDAVVVTATRVWLATSLSLSQIVSLLIGIIVPPLPEKSAVQKFQMTAEFIEQRRRALQVFINRVVSDDCACIVLQTLLSLCNTWVHGNIAKILE